ncbi:MAG: 50S ribosomal protein L10 [Candidatus Schekmanbacteria bacterium RBG_16_38_11]|uniref:Large ribosomal subunit protein uL10 n=2 Tax=Bacteria candidate phyla TaxID=1783234 RepID=A0A1F7RRQ9_9BACT|nr:MAG: 50S ribosomal protein L10 [Candidatus Gottesmanbacteria bacterium GW2011_GWC2_39_8]OGL44131.1 MAG: 50S ribosomal protein L10 [Candidatus Schekmanbacteria bacterium RBG_16_38_11]
MNRETKREKIQYLKERFNSINACILSDYRGLSVKEITELRRRLRGSGAELRVVKNTLAAMATEGTGFDQIKEHFSGPTAVTFCSNDPVRPAKILLDFSKENPKLELKVGILEGRAIGFSEIKALASTPPREVLLARMLASFNAPIGGMVNVLGGVLRNFMSVLQAISKKKEG